MKLKMKMLMKR